MKNKKTIISIIITAFITFLFTYKIYGSHPVDVEDGSSADDSTRYNFGECDFCNERVPTNFLFTEDDDQVCAICYHSGTQDLFDKDVGKCYRCNSFYYESESFGLGLCRSCGYSSVTECAFCGQDTLGWHNAWFSACEKCMGEAYNKTDIWDYLFDYFDNK